MKNLFVPLCTMAIAATTVWTLADLLRRPGAPELDRAELLKAHQILDDHQIELFERPSAKPGVYGNPGAHPKQLEVQQAFLEGQYRIVAATGGNQSGKTIGIAGLGVCKWIRDFCPDGTVVWVIGDNNDTIRDIPQKTLWQFLPRRMFPKKVQYHPKLGFGMIPTLELTLPDGRGKCEVRFKTSEADLSVYESARIDLAWWTEADREALFDALLPRLAARKGRMVIDTVPREPWHILRLKAPADAGDPDVFHRRFAMTDNSHNLPVGTIEFQRRQMSPEEAAVRIDGKDGAYEGVVFKEFRATPFIEDHPYEGGHIVPTRPIPRPKHNLRGRQIEQGWPVWVYIDVGKYTAALLLTAGPDGRKYIADEVYTLAMNVEQNVDEIKGMLTRNEVKIGDVRAFKMDPAAWSFTAANRVMVAEQYQQHGLPVTRWVAVQQFGEQAMLDKMRVEFTHRRLLVFDRCVKTALELQTWRHKTDRDGKIDPKEKYTGANHCIDAAKTWVWEDPGYHPQTITVIQRPDPWAIGA